MSFGSKNRQALSPTRPTPPTPHSPIPKVTFVAETCQISLLTSTELKEYAASIEDEASPTALVLNEGDIHDLSPPLSSSSNSHQPQPFIYLTILHPSPPPPLPSSSSIRIFTKTTLSIHQNTDPVTASSAFVQTFLPHHKKTNTLLHHLKSTIQNQKRMHLILQHNLSSSDFNKSNSSYITRLHSILKANPPNTVHRLQTSTPQSTILQMALPRPSSITTPQKRILKLTINLSLMSPFILYCYIGYEMKVAISKFKVSRLFDGFVDGERGEVLEVGGGDLRFGGGGKVYFEVEWVGGDIVGKKVVRKAVAVLKKEKKMVLHSKEWDSSIYEKDRQEAKPPSPTPVARSLSSSSSSLSSSKEEVFSVQQFISYTKENSSLEGEDEPLIQNNNNNNKSNLKPQIQNTDEMITAPLLNLNIEDEIKSKYSDNYAMSDTDNDSDSESLSSIEPPDTKSDTYSEVSDDNKYDDEENPRDELIRAGEEAVDEIKNGAFDVNVNIKGDERWGFEGFEEDEQEQEQRDEAAVSNRVGVETVDPAPLRVDGDNQEEVGTKSSISTIKNPNAIEFLNSPLPAWKTRLSFDESNGSIEPVFDVNESVDADLDKRDDIRSSGDEGGSSDALLSSAEGSAADSSSDLSSLQSTDDSSFMSLKPEIVPKIEESAEPLTKVQVLLKFLPRVLEFLHINEIGRSSQISTQLNAYISLNATTIYKTCVLAGGVTNEYRPRYWVHSSMNSNRFKNSSLSIVERKNQITKTVDYSKLYWDEVKRSTIKFSSLRGRNNTDADTGPSLGLVADIEMDVLRTYNYSQRSSDNGGGKFFWATPMKKKKKDKLKGEEKAEIADEKVDDVVIAGTDADVQIADSSPPELSAEEQAAAAKKAIKNAKKKIRKKKNKIRDTSSLSPHGDEGIPPPPENNELCSPGIPSPPHFAAIDRRTSVDLEQMNGYVQAKPNLQSQIEDEEVKVKEEVIVEVVAPLDSSDEINNSNTSNADVVKSLLHELCLDTSVDVLKTNKSKSKVYRQDKLRRILWAFAAHKPDNNYVQGMNMMMRLILDVLEGDEVATFTIMCSLNDHYNFSEIFKMREELDFCFYCVSKLIERNLPEIHAHLNDLDISSALYTTKWFLTLFACFNVVEFSAILRLWDAFFLCEWPVVFSVGLAAVKAIEGSLLNEMEFVEVMKMLQNPLIELERCRGEGGKEGDRNTILESLSTITVTGNEFEALRSDFFSGKEVDGIG